MKQQRPRIPQQLYTLLDTLEPYVDNRDELGLLIGYSILNSLLDFRTTTGAEEEIRFEEVKAVYDGLENTIRQVEKEGSYPALCDYQMAVDPKMQSYVREGVVMEQERAEGSSESKERSVGAKPRLLSTILSYLVDLKGNYPDKLRRRGLELFDDAQNRGPYKRRGSSLRNDYELIKNVMGGRRK